MRRWLVASCLGTVLALAACSGGDDPSHTDDTKVDAGSSIDGGPTTDASTDGAVAPVDGGVPSGWLSTEGNTIYVSDGAGGKRQWMGRGVNMDDLYLCGFDNELQMQTQATTAEDALQTLVLGLVGTWKPTFVRVSLSMNSFPTVSSWTTNPDQYKTPMTNVIRALGAKGIYVLVTLRTDASMGNEDPGDKEATAVPTNATDPVYRALVDTFANDAFVLFGLSNEPGGNVITKEALLPAMKHGVETIRAEEDALGVPHHLVSVQGTGYTSTIDFYSKAPLPYDDVVYEVHGYPPPPDSYTFANIPVILGEYGTLPDPDSFFADLEAKQIPSLAWDFEPYSNCSPDLVNQTHDATMLEPTPWGTTVQAYLLAHAK